MEKNLHENEELELQYEEEYEEEEYRGPSGVSLLLNRYFHHLDRGGSLGGEIVAGLAMFFLSICVIFMNMQLVGGVINSGVELVNAPDSAVNIAAASVYTQLYVGAILVSILGSLLMGLVAKLPFTQVSTMGFASSLLCLVGTQSGLTWENLLFINLLAGVLYAVLCAVPALRQGIVEAIPVPVRKTLPAALGLMTAYYALQMTGLVTTATISFGASQKITLINGLAVTDLRTLALCGIIGAAVAVGLFVLLKLLRRKHLVILPLLGGTVAFALASLLLGGTDTSNTESFINFGRVWLVAGSQASQFTPFGDSYLTYSMDAIGAVFGNMGGVFTKGVDFSAYTGNSLILVVSGVLCYVFAGLFSVQGAVLASEDRLNDPQVDLDKAMLCNALTNVAAPLFGVAGVAPGVSSVAAVKDNAKSGIASIVACIGFVISLFVMAFPALFATVTYGVPSMNTWNYFAYGNGGIVYLIQDVVFTVVDAMLICVGISMTAALKDLEWKNITQSIPAVITLVVSVLTANLLAGVACGTVLYLILSLGKDRKPLSVPMAIAAVLMVLTMVLL